jgi:hypothetical protein
MNLKRGAISLFSIKIKISHQNMMNSMIEALSSSGRNILSCMRALGNILEEKHEKKMSFDKSYI